MRGSGVLVARLQKTCMARRPQNIGRDPLRDLNRRFGKSNCPIGVERSVGQPIRLIRTTLTSIALPFKRPPIPYFMLSDTCRMLRI